MGTYGNQTGLRDASECVLCAPGKYCATVGLQEPTGECLAGYFCEAGAIDSFGEVEEEIAAGTRRVILCPAGHYCIEGAHVPMPCPPGTYCSGNNSLPWPCKPGTYNLEAMQSSCAPCPAGFICSPSGVVDYANGTFYASMGLSGCSRDQVLEHYSSSLLQSSAERLAEFVAAGGTVVACEVVSDGADFVCPAGHFCPEGLVNLEDGRCPGGT